MARNRSGDNVERLRVSAPGRISFFGEHQDCLGLPVISAAITLRITIEGTARQDDIVRVELPDINDVAEFSLSQDIKYTQERDYIRSVVNVLQREGVRLSHGYDCVLRGTIPMNAGVSSSSALCVAWTKFLLEAASDDRKDNADEIARLAHLAEVVEFGEPGGAMDHYSSSVGSLLHIRFLPEVQYKKIDVNLDGFVLGNSLEPKDTKKVLACVKDGVATATKRLSGTIQGFDLRFTSLAEVAAVGGSLPADGRFVLEGMLGIREMIKEAVRMLKAGTVNERLLGALLNAHYRASADLMGISTLKLETMCHAALNAGALGAKITGSGGGGCMFAYAPGREKQVAHAIEEAGGKAYIVRLDNGVRVD